MTIIAAAQSADSYSNIFYHIDTTRHEGDLLCRITNINFFKNNEYFGDYIEGYTMLGYKLQPSLVYYATNDISIEAGAQMLQYGGTTRFDHIYPILTAQWRINSWTTLIMGMLDGHMAHDLPESIWEPERQLSDKPEFGFQFKINRNTWNADAWMNWQQYIKNGDTIPERFTAGIALNICPWANRETNWIVKFPIRLLASHVGGQISNFSERMQSLTNYSAAIAIDRTINHKWFKTIGIELQKQSFYAMVDGGIRPFSKGWAIFPQIKLRTTNFNANLGYWKASNFFALYGNYMFMSLSNYKDNIYSKNRQLIVAETDFHHSINKVLKFAIGAKAYHDIDASQFDYSYHIDLVITPIWKIYGADKATKK